MRTRKNGNVVLWLHCKIVRKQPLLPLLFSDNVYTPMMRPCERRATSHSNAQQNRAAGIICDPGWKAVIILNIKMLPDYEGTRQKLLLLLETASGTMLNSIGGLTRRKAREWLNFAKIFLVLSLPDLTLRITVAINVHHVAYSYMYSPPWNMEAWNLIYRIWECTDQFINSLINLLRHVNFFYFL